LARSSRWSADVGVDRHAQRLGPRGPSRRPIGPRWSQSRDTGTCRRNAPSFPSATLGAVTSKQFFDWQTGGGTSDVMR
jgi:hypothetical protein